MNVHTTRKIPAGIERVIYQAAVDPSFYAALLADREAAVQGAGLLLSSSELAVLLKVPQAQLTAAVARMDTSPDNLRRRAFLGAVAAGTAMITLGCGDDDSGVKGIRPDETGPEAGPHDAAQDRAPADAGADSPASFGVRPGG